MRAGEMRRVESNVDYHCVWRAAANLEAHDQVLGSELRSRHVLDWLGGQLLSNSPS